MTTPTIINFTIHGNPIPKGRPRFVDGRAYTDGRTRDWEHVCAWKAKEAMRGRDMLTGEIGVWLRFYRGDRRRVDLDNLVKSCSDALNGVVWEDDSQIVSLHGWKGYDKAHPRVSVRVKERV